MSVLDTNARTLLSLWALAVVARAEPQRFALCSWSSNMRVKRAILCGVLGAGAISAASLIARAIGIPIQLELILGTAFGLAPGGTAFALGLAIHLAIGGAFGLLYGWLFETVWLHGGASTGMILAVPHAALVGMIVGFTPRFHPLIPGTIADPGAYFASVGTVGVVTFFAIHVLYGAVVGAVYGHVASERAWAPAGRL